MNQSKTQKLTITAIFVAIILLQSFVPFLGYITIFPALPAITTLPLTIAIFALLMGPGYGTTLGLLWGLISLYRAYTQPGSIVSLMLFQNPLIALIPRIAAGFIPGYIGKFIKNAKVSSKKAIFGYTLGGLSASLTNTILVILLTSIIFKNSDKLIHYLGGVQGSALIVVLMVALAANGIVEAIFTGIFTPIIVTPLKRVLNKR